MSRVAMRVSFIVVAGEPVPTRLAGQFINFTLPYLLHRFTGITIPDILVPVQFPRLSFDVSFPGSCSLKNKPEEQRLLGEKCLRLWGIVGA